MKPITIIGGGLAGLALGIGLRRLSIPVRVIEAGEYPRHRVCGEFLNGSGLRTLERLGLQGMLEGVGALRSRSAAFFGRDRCLGRRLLPVDARCVSRHVLDEALAEAFRRSGGELICGSRWTAGVCLEGMVRATGRRPVGVESGWRWVGLKGHAAGVSLTADLEMHFLPDGYVGLCPLPGGEVNVCGLFRRRAGVVPVAAGVLEPLRGPEGGLLWRRLEGASWNVDSACAVAGLSFLPRGAPAGVECCIGDALGMIPPLTGNGMSLAFESAELATGPVAGYARGECGWEAAVMAVTRRCEGAFRRRLRWSGWMHRALFLPAGLGGLAAVGLRFDPAWRWLFAVTR